MGFQQIFMNMVQNMFLLDSLCFGFFFSKCTSKFIYDKKELILYTPSVTFHFYDASGIKVRMYSGG